MKRRVSTGRRRKLAELQNKIQEGRAAKQELPKFREEVRQLELELDKLLRILPARRNTPDLMRRIRSLAEQGDFSLKRFNPGQPHRQGVLQRVADRRSSSRASYHNLALFFDRISRFSRIINIEDLDDQRPPVRTRRTERGDRTRSAPTFIAKTFVYKEPEPEDATAARQDRAGRGRRPRPRRRRGRRRGSGPAPAWRGRTRLMRFTKPRS